VTTSPIEPCPPFQFAWYVPNMEQAVEYWTGVVGIGPFFVSDVDASSYEGFTYRGGPGELTMRVAWAESEQGQIELIEVTSTAPNIYHDLVAADRTAFHHVGVWSDDYAADKARLSERYEIAQDMGARSNICYFDTSADSGTMLELIERNDGIVKTFSLIRQAADDWDGTRPLRNVAELF
jgi:hypothetical protein